MHSLRLKNILLAAVITVGSLTAHAQTGLRITEVYSAGNDNGTYATDWFELTNTSASTISLSGFKMDDGSNSFASSVTLAGIGSIAAGQSVIFLETSDLAGKTTAFNNAWFGTNTSSIVIGNYTGGGVGLSSGSGDSVNVFNASGTLLAKVSFGAITIGMTFDNTALVNSGTISLLSSAGVNGAFTSFNGSEIGSPGFAAIPEPSTYALLVGLAGLGLALARRKQIVAA